MTTPSRRLQIDNRPRTMTYEDMKRQDRYIIGTLVGIAGLIVSLLFVILYVGNGMKFDAAGYGCAIAGTVVSGILAIVFGVKAYRVQPSHRVAPSPRRPSESRSISSARRTPPRTAAIVPAPIEMQPRPISRSRSRSKQITVGPRSSPGLTHRFLTKVHMAPPPAAANS